MERIIVRSLVLRLRILQLIILLIASTTTAVVSFTANYVTSTFPGCSASSNPRRSKLQEKKIQVVAATATTTTTTTIKSRRSKSTITTERMMSSTPTDRSGGGGATNNDDNNIQPSTTEVVGQMLGGLVFLKTTRRQELVEFYTNRIGMSLWLEQPNITICSHGNLILGFHQCCTNKGEDDIPDLQGMYTFVYPSKDAVDDMYTKLQDIADGPPRKNERYKIYQFFAVDPEGRKLEFQVFLHPLSTVTSSSSEEVVVFK